MNIKREFLVRLNPIENFENNQEIYIQSKDLAIKLAELFNNC